MLEGNWQAPTAAVRLDALAVLMLVGMVQGVAMRVLFGMKPRNPAPVQLREAAGVDGCLSSPQRADTAWPSGS